MSVAFDAGVRESRMLDHKPPRIARTEMEEVLKGMPFVGTAENENATVHARSRSEMFDVDAQWAATSVGPKIGSIRALVSQGA